MERALTFVRTHHHGVLVTRMADGGPQTSPVLATTDADGAVVISTRETAFKVRNARRNPRVTYCGFTDRFFGDWVRVDGTAELIPLPTAMDGLIAYYRSIAGEHEDWDGYRAAMERERRVLLRIHADHAGPDRAG